MISELIFGNLYILGAKRHWVEDIFIVGGWIV